MSLITKVDFQDHLVRFSQNTPASLINPDIADAIRFDLPEVLPYKLLAAVLSFPTLVVTNYSADLVYLLGEYARTYENVDGLGTPKVWLSLASGNNANTPADGSLWWEYDDMASFIDGYVKPYAVICAYLRYKLENGIIDTPSGDRIFREDESDPISASQHASQLAKYKLKKGDYAILLQNELLRRGYLVNAIQYDIPGGCNNASQTTYRGGITAL